MISLLALFSLATYVSANTNFGLAISHATNWETSSSIKSSAPSSVKSQCSSANSFIYDFNGKPICSSSETRKAPSADLICPIQWDMHDSAQCCVPTQVSQICDCGEGYGWSGSGSKCGENTNPKCSGTQWFHERSESCCDDSWQPNEGSCPKGKTCPGGWYWHRNDECCRPQHKRSPQPDCNNWDEKDQCCHNNPSPSHGNHKDHGKGHMRGKRDYVARKQSAMFPQSQLDAMYCPNNLHACSVFTTHGGEWAYECVDFATELESCGGCASTGQGMDCTSIPHAMSVGCESGICAVYTCKMGFMPNGTACAPK